MDYYLQNEMQVSMIVFALGFIFDLLTLGRIDEFFNIIQQAAYILILGGLLIAEIKVSIGTLILDQRLKKYWEYHNLIVHFLFGSLLSAYTIFYFSSASTFTSFLFISLLVILMIANEFPQIQNLGIPVRVILFWICVLSYLSFFYPILIGHIGLIPFWLGLITSCVIAIIIWKLQFKNQAQLKFKVIVPTIGIHIFFLCAYYTSLIPPVPLALKKIGIYHQIEKKDGKYVGKYYPDEKSFFFQNQFFAKPNKKINVLLSIFSPTNFNDKINLKWYRHDKKRGWNLEDNIPLKIVGGREAGFRGFATKSNYSQGDWKIIVETTDGREVGEIKFEITIKNEQTSMEFESDSF